MPVTQWRLETSKARAEQMLVRYTIKSSMLMRIKQLITTNAYLNYINIRLNWDIML